MKDISTISTDLFNKIRSRFPSIKLGDAEGKATADPSTAQFFDITYKDHGQVNIKLDDSALVIIYSASLFDTMPAGVKQDWYEFLKDIRQFARRNLLTFDTREITKTNLDKRDYAYLAQSNKESQMSESKLFGTSKTSYQHVGNARLVVKHSQPVNYNMPAGRTQHIESIYIESTNGERFKYPARHLNGARAMARHIANGGNIYDSVGSYIVGLSEELGQLRRFKNYTKKAGVVAEALGDITEKVSNRIDQIKEEIGRLQRQQYYAQFKESFTPSVQEEVPAETVSAWVDALTVRTFNEDLKTVFPYIYKLVNEKTATLDYEDIVAEATVEENEVDLEVGDEIIVTYPNQFQGKRGEIVGFGRNKAFVIVEIDGGEYSMHSSDVERLSGDNYDDDDSEVDETRYAPGEYNGEHDSDKDYSWSPSNRKNIEIGDIVTVKASGEFGRVVDFAHSKNMLIVDIKGTPYSLHIDEVGFNPLFAEYVQRVEAAATPSFAVNEGHIDRRIISGLIHGDLDVYTVMNHPSTPDEREASLTLRKLYDEVVADTGLHPDDDHDEINDQVFNKLVDMYGAAEDEPMFTYEEADEEECGCTEDTVNPCEDCQQRLAAERNSKNKIGNEVLEFIQSMYDSTSRSFPRGEEGVKIAVEKKFGPSAGKFAHYVVEKLSANANTQTIDEDHTATLTRLAQQGKEISDKIDQIVKSGGRVSLTDPLSQKLFAIRNQIKKLKSKSAVNTQGAVAEDDKTDNVLRIQKLAGV